MPNDESPPIVTASAYVRPRARSVRQLRAQVPEPDAGPPRCGRARHARSGGSIARETLAGDVASVSDVATRTMRCGGFTGVMSSRAPEWTKRSVAANRGVLAKQVSRDEPGRYAVHRDPRALSRAASSIVNIMFASLD